MADAVLTVGATGDCCLRSAGSKACTWATAVQIVHGTRTTAAARLAEAQLAFERQEAPAAIVQGRRARSHDRRRITSSQMSQLGSHNPRSSARCVQQLRRDFGHGWTWRRNRDLADLDDQNAIDVSVRLDSRPDQQTVKHKIANSFRMAGWIDVFPCEPLQHKQVRE